MTIDHEQDSIHQPTMQDSLTKDELTGTVGYQTNHNDLLNSKEHLLLDRSFMSRGAHIGNSSFLQSSAGFSQKRHSFQFGSSREDSSICVNPLVMRGSLNSNQRKNELIRINRGNKVSNIFSFF